MDLYVGLLLNDEPGKFEEQLSQLMTSIATAGPADTSAVVRGVVVGNEGVFRNEYNITQLVDYISDTRRALASAGLSSIQVSAAEVFLIFRENQELIDAVDFILPNL
jgi:exo-beta-1,3-glucanase (GH17 family)